MKFYFVAGENSGDFIGAKIIESIKKNNPDNTDILFCGVGGSQMEAAGIKPLFDFQEINLMGFFEVLPHISRIKNLINKTVSDIISNDTDILITIDSPGFTFRVANKVRKIAPKIKLVHIVAPSVWAYKEGRAKKYSKVYDKLLALLPFEPPYFAKHGLSTEFIGYPVLEQKFYAKSEKLRREFNIANDKKIITITPGSRKSEISRHMPIIRKTLDLLSLTHKITVIFVQLNELYIEHISKYLIAAKFDFLFSTERLKSFAVSDVALAKSGTNTLEIAASGTPMIVGYKLNSLTYSILKIFLKIQYANIINIISNKEVIPEYIQSDFTAINISNALSNLIANPNKANVQVTTAKKILKTIGLDSKKLPTEKAASIIFAMAIKK
ncbi:MAG: lipid-A-disaccharide synthase [Rickettsiaceae bacterium]